MTADPASPGTPDVTVLVVDDQPPFRAAARSVVDWLKGFEVAEAESGEEAIEMVASLHPQLVLMDINMGEIDGIEATATITLRHPETRVVLVSTYELDDLPSSARTCGAIAYVNKADFGGPALAQPVGKRRRFRLPQCLSERLQTEVTAGGSHPG